MRIGRGATGVICGASALLLGCGGGGSGGSVPLNQLGSQYASIFCHKAFTCCDAAELAADSVTSVDEATCRSIVGPQIADNLASDQANIGAGRLVYHGDNARRCLDLIAALACSQWGGDEELARFPDCRHVFEGRVAPSAPCTLDVECADGFCDITIGSVCVARGKLGDDCAGKLCADGLTCLSDATTGLPGICGAPLGDGSTCAFNDECASAFCDIDTATNTASCGPATFCNGV